MNDKPTQGFMSWPLRNAGKLPLTPKKDDFGLMPIVDAAVEVATFSKTHEYPKEGSADFYTFAELLDRLATAINAAYPAFNTNIRKASP